MLTYGRLLGDRHASEISMLAMDILSATSTFVIRHMPQVSTHINILSVYNKSTQVCLIKNTILFIQA